MYQDQIRSTVAFLIIIGHLAVFLAGLLLGVFGPLAGTDVIQIVVMALPVLGATAFAAINYILENEKGSQRLYKVSSAFATVTIAIPLCLFAAIFLIFYCSYIQVQGFGPDNMKVSLGGVETIFGSYLGAISTKLFGKIGSSAPLV
ncbi:hypothetical protein [Rhizobium leguminosarum]|uniref:hypothetical protein n=1 Tax=Rhizobium leguminosarum TaxID=384 RepID=UPI0012BCB4DC|nr:hypothetical protein [Rhizobium leguminosarum]